MHLINIDVNNSGTLGRRDEPITKFNDFKLLKPSLKSESVSCSVMSNSLQHYGLQPARLPCSWDFLGKSTGVGCHSLLQGISLTQGLNPCLLHCRQILYLPLSLSFEPLGKPRIFPSHPSDETASLYPLTPFSWQAMGPVFGGFKDNSDRFSLSCIGEGNGTPLQYSCLEDPMDGGAWWAGVHGVTKSRT